MEGGLTYSYACGVIGTTEQHCFVHAVFETANNDARGIRSAHSLPVRQAAASALWHHE